MATRSLLPLNSLRVLESVARHSSFSKASEELHVTPGAISQQIKALEETLGAPVVRRQGRGIVLTPEAAEALPALREGFARLAEAGDILRRRSESGRLSISVAPSLAAKWLVPRLDRFHESHPDIHVWLSADMEVVDFAVDDVDLAIRYGGGQYNGLAVTKLMSETIIPVCSPRLLTGDPPLRTPRDLCHHTLLHDRSPDKDDSCPDWAMWLKAAGVLGAEDCEIDAMKGPAFNQSSLVIEAAVAGRGVALAKAALALADLEAARLVIPFDLTTPTDFAYWIVHPQGRGETRAVRAFSRWLLEEAQASAESKARQIHR